MSIVENKNAFVGSAATSIGVSQMFTVTAATSNPAYLVLTLLDRNEYTAGASTAVGNLSGNSKTLNVAGIGGDGRGTGIVFTYVPASGRYYSGTYGYFDQLTYNSSGSLADVTNLSLFGTSSLNLATSYATNAYAMMQSDPAGYLGSATVVTQPKFSGAVPVQATPNSIAAVATGFVGQAWNMDGCWVLASTIAADAGASLPVQTSEIGLSGQSNGEWIVAFNGPAGQSANWQSLVRAGEIIVIGTPGGGGHITTCVSGTGSTAMLVDNAVYENSSGKITNPANDGSSNDILIMAPHAASMEWSGVAASSVVIYELDTPIVTAATIPGASLGVGASEGIGALFTAVDPANKTITQWQVYDTAASDMLVVGGISYSDHSAGSALTTASLTSVSLLAGAVVTTDTLEVRAYNGGYWGDWSSLNVAITGSSASAPVLKAQTPAQTWVGGKPISLAVAFTDPQNQALTYSARLSNGQPLPTWLTFSTANDTFSGTAATTAQTLSIVVTAKDTGLLSTTDTFTATVIGTPVLAIQTATQTWTAGKSFSLSLPAGTFTDPQGQHMTYAATQSSGLPLPAWLGFNPATDTFSGTAPATAQTLALRVTATDSSGLTESDTFAAVVQSGAPTPIATKPAISLSAQTAKQTWSDGQSVTLVLPGNTFTDALGLNMTFVAYEVSGPNVTSWLHFNAAADEFYGTVPSNATGTIGLEVVASDAQHVTAADLFSVTFTSGANHAPAGVTSAMYGPSGMPVPVTMLGMLGLPS